MSQKKVEAYKEYKKNKKEVIKKEKARKRLTAGIATLVVIAVIGWFGWSIYEKATYEEPDGSGVTVNMTEFDQYTNELTTTYSGWEEPAE